MTASYEDLMGAFGRDAYFRPERRAARGLLSRDARPRVRVHHVECGVHDLSLTGVSFQLPPGLELATGEELPLEMVVHDETVFHGLARVVRIESGRLGRMAAVTLLTDVLDVDDLVRRDEERRLQIELERGPLGVLELVPPAYFDVVARAAHFVQHYRRELDRQEARLKAAGASDEALVELARKAAETVLPRWNAFERAASEAALPILGDPDRLAAAKSVTETLLTSLMLDVPLVDRAYNKPLGYPGDYQVMLYYYENGYRGGSVFAKVFHKIFMEHPLAIGVRTRKAYMAGALTSEHRRARASRPRDHFRALSLGCGPAVEIAEFIPSCDVPDSRVELTLVDQEDEVLSIAYGGARRALAARGTQGRVSCLNVSFAQLAKDPSLLRRVGAQDFIYSVGLFDYLRESRAKELIGGLFDRLAPGGTLAVGNAAAPNMHFWAPELVGDWSILYRSRKDMERLSEALPAGTAWTVELEPGGYYFFLRARRTDG